MHSWGFHFTPTRASWLNMVEAGLRMLTRKSIRRGSLDTARAKRKSNPHAKLFREPL